MLRFTLLLAVGTLVMLPTAAFAQPGVPGSFRVVDAKVDKGKVTWTETQLVPTTKEVEVVVVINGVNVKQKRALTVLVPVVETLAADLKDLKATDGAGKAIDADKLAELLKESTPVVIVSGPVPEKHRKLFKDTTVFVDLSQKVPGPVPVPAPPAVIVPPGAAPPVVLPPGEKKEGR